jgi:hypothetical protein
MANNNDVIVIKTDKGKEGICYLGYVYRFGKRGANDRIFWRCIIKDCKGRLATDEDNSNPEIRTGHDNHPPNPDLVEVREVKTACRNRAAAEFTPLRTVYDQETAVLANNPRAGALMPVFRSVSTTMLRERHATFPPLPKRRTDIVIPQELQVTNTGQQFVLHCAVNNDFIIFATDNNLRQLCSAPLVTMDGTFDTAPRLYRQIFTLHSFEDKHLVPLVYVLMSKKTQAMYSAIFAHLKWECQRLGLQLTMADIMSDFESGLMPAVTQEFPTSRHRGCHFHFCQVCRYLFLRTNKNVIY